MLKLNDSVIQGDQGTRTSIFRHLLPIIPVLELQFLGNESMNHLILTFLLFYESFNISIAQTLIYAL